MELITKSRYTTEHVGVFDFAGRNEWSDNILIDEILAQGDRIKHKSNVKAPMTEWNMCLESKEFGKLANVIVREGCIPYLSSFYMNEKDIKAQRYAVVDMWGAEYRGNGEDFTQSHDHRHSFVSFSYYLKCPKNCPPLVFDDLNIKIDPKPGMLVCFRGDMKHSVPKGKHEGSRIMIAGNTMVMPQNKMMEELLKMEGYEVNAPISNS